MSVLQVDSPDFFSRARHEAERYGKDPWVFLRELVQNSRDASASSIQFTAKHQDQWEILTCLDTGTGMDAAELEHYLLRLYASSKESDESSVGFFGVGFWSILRFEPTLIRIASRKGPSQHGIEIRPLEGCVSEYEFPLDQDGTLITLYRPIGKTSESDYCSLLRKRLEYYAGAVTPAAKVASISLQLNGQQIKNPLSEPILVAQPIKGPNFTGLVGFDRKPSVRLYKGGLLIRDLAELSELIPSRKPRKLVTLEGFYPVVILQMEQAQVLMDRQHIFEDDRLRQAVKTCEEALADLTSDLIHQLMPMSLFQRLRHALRTGSLYKWVRQLRFSWLEILFVLLALTVGIRYAPSWEGDSIGEPPFAYVDDALANFTGIFTEPISHDGQVTRWGFFYEGKANAQFRIATFSEFARVEGFLKPTHTPVKPYKTVADPGSDTIKIQMMVSPSSDWALLPVPFNYRIVSGSLQGRGVDDELWEDPFFEPMVRVNQTSMVRYTVAPSVELRPPLTYAPPPREDWPPPQKAVIDKAKTLPTPQAVKAIQDYISTNFNYSHQASSMSLDATKKSIFRWVDNVLIAREGDCDVLNGLAVLMLREAGIHAELWTGLVGTGGTIHQELHAWAVYYKEGWHELDLTLTTPTADNPTAEPPLPEREDPPSEPGPRAKTGRPKWHIPFSRWVLLPVLAVCLLWLAFDIRKNKGVKLQLRLNKPDEEDLIKGLFKHLFHTAELKDTHDIRSRPIFPVLGGPKLCFNQIQALANRGVLLYGSSHTNLISQLTQPIPVLDARDPIYLKLIEYLPTLTRLEQLEVLLTRSPLPEPLAQIEARVRTFDPLFRLHLHPEIPCLELVLAFKNPSLGSHHLIISGPTFFCGPDGSMPTDELVLVHRVLSTMRLYTYRYERFLSQWVENESKAVAP